MTLRLSDFGVDTSYLIVFPFLIIPLQGNCFCLFILSGLSTSQLNNYVLLRITEAAFKA